MQLFYHFWQGPACGATQSALSGFNQARGDFANKTSNALSLEKTGLELKVFFSHNPCELKPCKSSHFLIDIIEILDLFTPILKDV